jgi:pimeloyl-ACP methyl ester carboxylesterase
MRNSATSADGVSIAYETLGAGTPALVFVHGWSCDRSYWEGQLEPFSRDFLVVALDLAGHGESGMDREEWTIRSYGADVATVVEVLELDRVILIGHSMGGDVVVDAARLLPGRVVGMVWVDTYSQLGRVRTPDQVEAFLAPLRADFADGTYTFVRRNLFPPTADPALVERVASDMASAPQEIALASLESSITNDRVVPGALEELDVPVVSLNPARSNPDVASLERHGVEVILVPDVGHFMMMEDPAAFNAILRGVVEGLLR